MKKAALTLLMLATFSYLYCANFKDMPKIHNQTGTKEHRTWILIKYRCHTATASDYYRYGGRGIKVCDRWRSSFMDFLSDMGRAPSPKHTIDRINVHGNYEPGNCRWATNLEQSNNRGNNIFFEYNGESRTISDWCRLLGLQTQTVYVRVKKGMSFSDAVNKPIDKKYSSIERAKKTAFKVTP